MPCVLIQEGQRRSGAIQPTHGLLCDVLVSFEVLRCLDFGLEGEGEPNPKGYTMPMHCHLARAPGPR